ncbi:MAG: protein kinase [Rectinema sp.]|nr:protein kinase [Rectinema sp.]
MADFHRSWSAESAQDRSPRLSRASRAAEQATAGQEETVTLLSLRIRSSSEASPAPEMRQARTFDGRSALFSENDRVGRGGFGAAYLASIGPDRVVVKEISFPQSENERRREQKRRMSFVEAHGNLTMHKAQQRSEEVRACTARVYGVDVMPQRATFVLQYIRGESMERMVDSVSTNEGCAQALRALRDVVHAVQALHKASVAHGDLKPTNVMVSQGKAYLIDFGLCREVDERGRGKTTEETKNLMACTPSYHPMINKDGVPYPEPIGVHADRYQLGRMIAEVALRLYGQRPRLEPGKEHDGRLVQEVRRHVSADLGDAIAGLLASKPTDRTEHAMQHAAEALGRLAMEHEQRAVEESENRLKTSDLITISFQRIRSSIMNALSSRNDRRQITDRAHET